VIEIKCDKCGKTCTDLEFTGNHNYMGCKSNFGYPSKLDSEDFEYHLCEDCVELFMKWLKIKEDDGKDS